MIIGVVWLQPRHLWLQPILNFEETVLHMNSTTTHILSRLRQWLLSEPLVHFIVLGALIFFAYGAFASKDSTGQRWIEVSAQDVARLRDISIRQWGQEPDAKTMHDLVQSFVREEVLYREALASGLDRDDAIVRRRLAQKMDFLANEEVRPATEADLRAHFESHKQHYQQAALLDFEQVYFSTAARGAATLANANQALASLRTGRTVQGDNFMLPRSVVQQDQQQLQRDYGSDFAKALLALPEGDWAGPIASAHGLHLVRVKHHGARMLRFEEVRARVAADFTQTSVEKARQDAYERFAAGYTIVTPALDTQVAKP